MSAVKFYLKNDNARIFCLADSKASRIFRAVFRIILGGIFLTLASRAQSLRRPKIDCISTYGPIFPASIYAKSLFKNSLCVIGGCTMKKAHNVKDSREKLIVKVKKKLSHAAPKAPSEGQTPV